MGVYSMDGHRRPYGGAETKSDRDIGEEIVHYPRSMEMYNDAIFQLALGSDH